MTAVIYARYSSDSQREASIEGQLRDCKDYAEKNGITVVGTYIDRAYSAKTDDRPDFQRMIKDSAKKIFDVVLVWKLDRFARNRYDAVNYKYQLEKNGVHLVSAMEPISQGPEGIMGQIILWKSAFSCGLVVLLSASSAPFPSLLHCSPYPVVEYRVEGFDMFDAMIESIREDTVKMMLIMPKRVYEIQKRQDAIAATPTATTPPALS